jgi:hypothetical protein
MLLSKMEKSTANGFEAIWPDKYRKQASASSRSMALLGRDQDLGCWMTANVYQASSDVNGGTVTVGYPYSLLEWCVEPHSSWSLPIDARRVPSTNGPRSRHRTNPSSGEHPFDLFGSVGYRGSRWQVQNAGFCAQSKGCAV